MKVSVRTMFFCASLFVVSVVAIMKAHQVGPFSTEWSVKDARVVLADCEHDCVLEGTLSRDDQMDMFYIDHMSGRTYFGFNGFLSMSWPMELNGVSHAEY